MSHEELKALAKQWATPSGQKWYPKQAYQWLAESYLAITAQLEEAQAERDAYASKLHKLQASRGQGEVSI
jgi:hypothetical protein